MIKGFETETGSFTDSEKKMIPIIIKGLWNKYGSDNSVTSTHIIKKMKESGHKLTGARLRKIINYIRIEGIIADLVGTSKGYYREQDGEKLKDYIQGLRDRASAINAVADSMEKCL